MSQVEQLKQLENAVIHILNLDGWELEPTEQMEHFDAIGKTPKGHKCVIEMKFRNDYYEDKMLEVYKYDRLMEMKDYIHIYFVADNKGNYFFWLDDIEMPEPITMNVRKTTMWNNNKVDKQIYLLPEYKAIIKNLY